MTQIADLEIDVRRRADKDYAVEFRFLPPGGDAEVRLLRDRAGRKPLRSFGASKPNTLASTASKWRSRKSGGSLPSSIRNRIWSSSSCDKLIEGGR